MIRRCESLAKDRIPWFGASGVKSHSIVFVCHQATLESVEPDRPKNRRRSIVSGPYSQAAPNLQKQNFHPTAPNRQSVADITYLPTLEGWVYLTVVIDLFSRKVIGWSISDSLSIPLVREAMKQAIESRRPGSGELIHHSDRGCQSASLGLPHPSKSLPNSVVTKARFTESLLAIPQRPVTAQSAPIGWR